MKKTDKGIDENPTLTLSSSLVTWWVLKDNQRTCKLRGRERGNLELV